MRASERKLITRSIGAYVAVIRGTPFVVQIFIIFFILPEWGIQLDAFPAAVLALTILGTAFICEILAGGIRAVPKGHWEAATSSELSVVTTTPGYRTPGHADYPSAPGGPVCPFNKRLLGGFGHRRGGADPGGLVNRGENTRGADGVQFGGHSLFCHFLSTDPFIQQPGAEDGCSGSSAITKGL
jgi:Binding-protein-dependent transport system inner membrane component